MPHFTTTTSLPCFLIALAGGAGCILAPAADLGDGPTPALARASDGFALLTHLGEPAESTIWSFMHDIPEPIWTTQVPFAGAQVVDVSLQGRVAVSGPEGVAFYTPEGVLLASHGQDVTTLQVHDLVFSSPDTLFEAADGPELGAMEPTATVDALLTAHHINGMCVARPYRWGDLDCEGELVPRDERFYALAYPDGDSLMAVGEETYEFTPGEPTTIPRIMETSPVGTILGGARIALPNARATQVFAEEGSLYVVIQDESGAAFDYQIRKYVRAYP